MAGNCLQIAWLLESTLRSNLNLLNRLSKQATENGRTWNKVQEKILGPEFPTLSVSNLITVRCCDHIGTSTTECRSILYCFSYSALRRLSLGGAKSSYHWPLRKPFGDEDRRQELSSCSGESTEELLMVITQWPVRTCQAVRLWKKGLFASPRHRERVSSRSQSRWSADSTSVRKRCAQSDACCQSTS